MKELIPKYGFGKRSNANIDTCHPDLQLILREALADSDVDFSVTEGHRSTERQIFLHSIGKSTRDGVSRLSKHQSSPSMAADIVIYTKLKKYRKRVAYDWSHLAHVSGVMTATAKRLYRQGRVTHLIRWGGNWNKNGILKLDQSFQDGPHFELYQP